MRTTSKHVVLLTLPLLLAAGGCGYGPFTNKGYIGDDVVRMAQPTESGLKSTLEKDKIKTVLNLRGENAGKDWYDVEAQFAQENDLDFYSVRLSKGRLPTRQQLGDLIRILKTAKYPLMMHCQSGADRTGFAATVYRLVVLKDPLDKALESFTVWHGHIEQDTPLDKLFDAYRDEANGRSFEEWFEKDFDVERLNKKLEIPPKSLVPEDSMLDRPPLPVVLVFRHAG